MRNVEISFIGPRFSYFVCIYTVEMTIKTNSKLGTVTYPGSAGGIRITLVSICCVQFLHFKSACGGIWLRVKLFGIRTAQASIAVLVRWTQFVSHILIETLHAIESDDYAFICNRTFVCMLLIGDMMALSMKGQQHFCYFQ